MDVISSAPQLIAEKGTSATIKRKVTGVIYTLLKDIGFAALIAADFTSSKIVGSGQVLLTYLSSFLFQLGVLVGSTGAKLTNPVTILDGIKDVKDWFEIVDQLRFLHLLMS